MDARPRDAPAPAWFGSAAKLGYIVVVRLVSTVIANVFLWSGEIFYAPYTDVGLSDQAAAGAILMVEGSLVTIAAFAWIFLRLFSEGERRQELLEQGVDPRSVERAVRLGGPTTCHRIRAHPPKGVAMSTMPPGNESPPPSSGSPVWSGTNMPDMARLPIPATPSLRST